MIQLWYRKEKFDTSPISRFWGFNTEYSSCFFSRYCASKKTRWLQLTSKLELICNLTRNSTYFLHLHRVQTHPAKRIFGRKHFISNVTRKHAHFSPGALCCRHNTFEIFDFYPASLHLFWSFSSHGRLFLASIQYLKYLFWWTWILGSSPV